MIDCVMIVGMCRSAIVQ